MSDRKLTFFFIKVHKLILNHWMFYNSIYCLIRRCKKMAKMCTYTLMWLAFLPRSSDFWQWFMELTSGRTRGYIQWRYFSIHTRITPIWSSVYFPILNGICRFCWAWRDFLLYRMRKPDYQIQHPYRRKPRKSSIDSGKGAYHTVYDFLIFFLRFAVDDEFH